MILFIDDIQKKFSSDEPGLSELLEFLNDYEDNSSNILSGFEVDGEEVYEDLGEYLTPVVSEINEIRAITQTPEEYVRGIIFSSYDYMENGKNLISSLASKFYIGANEEDFHTLSDLCDGILWLMQSADIIDKNPGLISSVEDRESWNEYYIKIISLREILNGIFSGLKIRDMILIADYLKYEILPSFEEAMKYLSRFFQ